MATTGWYGPLIDLSDAASHLDGFVQLLVFVHRSRPSQRYNDLAGRASQWIDLSVGDDTLSYFSVSAWKKHLGHAITPGSIILLQNVKPVKHKDVVEAMASEVSSVHVLAGPCNNMQDVKPVKHKDVVEAIASEVSSVHVLAGPCNNMQGNHGPASCEVGATKNNKLKRVTEWVQQTGLWLSDIQRVRPHQGSMAKNWISEEQDSPTNCLSISEVLLSTSSGCVKFSASIGEIVVIDPIKDNKMTKPKLSIRKSPFLPADSVVDDLICMGCKICGSLLIPSSLDKCTTAFYCDKSSDHVHVLGSIYKPFLLCVTDQHGQLPILVKNKAAEILFGNITAEKVMTSYSCKRAAKRHRSGAYSLETDCLHYKIPKIFKVEQTDRQLKDTVVAESLNKQRHPDFYNIWLILLKCLLTHDKNSPFRFEVMIDINKVQLNGTSHLSESQVARHENVCEKGFHEYATSLPRTTCKVAVLT